MEDRDLPKFVRDRLRELERSAALARHDFEAARSELDAAQRQMFDARLKARGQSQGPEQAEALRHRADEQQARVSELDQRVRDLANSHSGAVSAVTQCRTLLSELPAGSRLEDADLPEPPDLLSRSGGGGGAAGSDARPGAGPRSQGESARRLVEQHAADLAGTVDIRALVDRSGRLSVNVHGQLDPLALLCAAQPDRAAELLLASARRANIGRPGDPLHPGGAAAPAGRAERADRRRGAGRGGRPAGGGQGRATGRCGAWSTPGTSSGSAWSEGLSRRRRAA